MLSLARHITVQLLQLPVLLEAVLKEPILQLLQLLIQLGNLLTMMSLSQLGLFLGYRVLPRPVLQQDRHIPQLLIVLFLQPSNLLRQFTDELLPLRIVPLPLQIETAPQFLHRPLQTLNLLTVKRFLPLLRLLHPTLEITLQIRHLLLAVLIGLIGLDPQPIVLLLQAD
jgi:hypothetical protein